MSEFTFDDFQKNLRKKQADDFAVTLQEAKNEADNAWDLLRQFGMLVSDAQAYGAWEDTVSELERQRKVMEAEWLRRKRIAELCEWGFNARFSDLNENKTE